MLTYMKYECQFPNHHQKLYHIPKAQPNTFSNGHPNSTLIFQWPGSGDYFHNLHHKHFDCNYGAMHVPMDYWFGTYAGGKEDIATIWRGGEKAGEEANETTVHEASSIKKQS